GKIISLPKLRTLSETTREGSSLKNIADAAEKIGFKTIGVKIDFNKLEEEAPLPVIVHWKQNHFVVVYKIKKGKVFVADPGHGLLEYTIEEFVSNWIGEKATVNTEEGIALVLEATPRLNRDELDEDSKNKQGFKFLFSYLFKYKKFLIQLIIGLLAGSLIQLIFPFITQSVVDIGVQNQDMNFIFLLLFAQIALFIGSTTVDLIRGWILLHLSTRINISLVSDFFIKLMNLPIAYFDTKMTGDILQRINDHSRIEQLLTGTSLSVLFSMFNLLIFGGVLAYYDLSIFFVFLFGSALYFAWVMLFLKRRKDLDYKRFSQVSEEQSKVIELINGMQEIKLHNAEKQKRWSWEFIQARLFKIEMKNLSLEQTQNIGAQFINEMKNIFITFLSASLVISGDLTLGMMLSISYIIGQLNSPIMQLVGFVHSLQDTKISLERLGEIHNRDDEETAGEEKISEIDLDQNMELSNLSFRYTGAANNVLNSLNLTVPANKITAIVGASGSGKTTLMKLMLKFYEPNEGSYKLAGTDVSNISQKTWRNACGVVMQEGYIFNDTISNNIAIGETIIDREKLRKAVKVANIEEYINSLPLGYNTKIGMEGIGLSTGQKQRILIARAVYKDPEILFFDEATSALDAHNERIIMENLNEFFKNKTVIIIAHRLSTVKNAHQIVVLNKGKILEKGNHDSLVKEKGEYYKLVKNQLDLESMND
ncbi:MAG: peptidase domain-containing ABC transporter, partial [Flavobacteriales bacterium]